MSQNPSKHLSNHLTHQLSHRASLSASPRSFAKTRVRLGALLAVGSVLAACGGSSDTGIAADASTSPAFAYKTAAGVRIEPVVMTSEDAVRLAHQATFGPTESLVAEIRSQGAAAWVQGQQLLSVSRYTLGNGAEIHRNVSTTDFCAQPSHGGSSCWRDWYSTQPLLWDFYRNATRQPDQLRQRVAFALQQILVVSNLDVQGTYGFRYYHNALLDQAFGNYRDLLRKVTLSPVMGEYLNHVNNDTSAPNENYARELLQLFSLGTCRIESDGSLVGDVCAPVYSNDQVRAYAQALTGWTYPAGGSSSWGCLPTGSNCRYYGADMVPAPTLRDLQQRDLLSGVRVPAGATAPAALEHVLDSLLQHPNMAPFVARQLIQHLTSSNPTPAYIQRVAAAFSAGRLSHDGQTFGVGRTGDLAATVAAVLLDREVRAPLLDAPDGSGKLREPVLYFTGVLRALNGQTDGEVLGSWWGESLRQHVFRAPSVFSFYPTDYPLADSTYVAPSFGIHNVGSAFDRLNYLTFLLQWGGATAQAGVPGATGTGISTAAFEGVAGNAGALVDRLATLATGQPLPADVQRVVVDAVETITNVGNAQWKSDRVRQAAFLIFASPQYQVYR